MLWTNILLAVMAFTILSHHQLPPEKVTIRVEIKLDGKDVAPPKEVVLGFRSRSIKVPIRNGTFTVPREVVTQDEVAFSLDTKQHRIRITVPGWRFEAKHWVLVMATSSYGEDYDVYVPKGANVNTSCIVFFRAGDYDAAPVLFIDPCRAPNHR